MAQDEKWFSKMNQWLFANKDTKSRTEEDETKFLSTGSLGTNFSTWGGGLAQRGIEDYATYARVAYMYNAVAYRCINIIASASANLKFKTYRDETQLDRKFPLNQLLSTPNPFDNRIAFFKKLYATLLISGNAFILKTEAGAGDSLRVADLRLLRPDYMEVKLHKRFGTPKEYIYHIDKENPKSFSVNPVNGESRVIHIKLMNPLHEWRGLSPISAAWSQISQYNSILQHNLNLLENGVRIGGALKYNPKDETGAGAELSGEQHDAMMSEIKQKFEGSRNSGKMMLLTGDWDFLPYGINPKDMDFKEFIKIAGRDIAMAFGVDPSLIGIGENQTFNNFATARLSMYTDTVVPLCDEVLDDLNKFLIPKDQQGMLRIEYCYDDAPAMAEQRKQIIENNIKLVDRGVINRDEFRERLSMEKIPGGDQYLIPNNVFPLEDVAAAPAESETPEDDAKAAYGA